MNKRLFCFALSMLILCVTAKAQEEWEIDKYIAKNPQTVMYRCLKEGCSLSMSADDSNLLVQVFIGHPIIQMRLLMQEWTVYIDPTGRKKEKYAITLPGGENVKKQMGSLPQAPTSPDSDNKRPDIGKLVAMLNLHGATWDINGKIQHLDASSFRIDIDEDREGVVYSVLVPINEMMNESKWIDNWKVGLYAGINNQAAPQGMRPGGGPGGPGGGNGPGGNNGPGGQRPNGQMGNEREMRDYMTKEIKEWVNVVYSDIFNVNKDNGHALLVNVTGEGFVCKASKENVWLNLIQNKDSIDIYMDVNKSDKQLPFIMQGLTMRLESEKGDNLLEITYPSAMDVQEQLKHHPNETKKNAPEGMNPVRPDLGYVVEALNNLLPTVDNNVTVLDYSIELDTAKSVLRYHIKLITSKAIEKGSMRKVRLISEAKKEMQDQSEFNNDSTIEGIDNSRSGEKKGIVINMILALDCFDGRD